ncbi:hypothetical protein OH77DRAFT_929891 [Trametes cingulata]|nr:hypothetical protein OH77DRAFT_929891 [Trametes cingulata]
MGGMVPRQARPGPAPVPVRQPSKSAQCAQWRISGVLGDMSAAEFALAMERGPDPRRADDIARAERPVAAGAWTGFHDARFAAAFANVSDVLDLDCPHNPPVSNALARVLQPKR